MTSQAQTAETPAADSAAEPVPTATAVESYLRDNPGFFAEHPQLLAELKLPHGPEGVISLVEYQVRRLREERDVLRERLDAIIEVAQANHATQARFHALHLRLLAAADLDALWATLAEALRTDFGAERIALALPGLTPAEDNIHRRDFAADQAEGFEFVLSSGEPLCGRLTDAQLGYLFGEADHEAVASAVVLPLAADHHHGLLGLGSADQARYQPDQDTTYLSQLGEFVGSLYLRLRG